MKLSRTIVTTVITPIVVLENGDCKELSSFVEYGEIGDIKGSKLARKNEETVNEAKEFAGEEKYQIKAQTYTEEAKYTIDVNDFIKYANKEA